jgi:hypothetical protein
VRFCCLSLTNFFFNTLVSEALLDAFQNFVCALGSYNEQNELESKYLRGEISVHELKHISA